MDMFTRRLLMRKLPILVASPLALAAAILVRFFVG